MSRDGFKVCSMWQGGVIPAEVSSPACRAVSFVDSADCSGHWLVMLFETFGSSLFFANRSKCAKELQFEVCVHNRSGLFLSNQSVEFFSMGLSDCAKYNRQARVWWSQYELSALLFMPRPLSLTYYILLAIRGSADDKTRVCCNALPDNVFMAGGVFLISVRDGDCFISYTC